MNVSPWITGGFGLTAAILLLGVVGTADEPPALPRACIDGTGPGWRVLDEQDFTAVNCDSRNMDLEGRCDPLHGKPGGRDPHQEAIHQFRACCPLAAPSFRRGIPASSSGRRNGPSQDSSRENCLPAVSRFKCSITVMPSNMRRRPARNPTGSPPTAMSSPLAHRG